ncbi:MAG: 2-oxoglutarate dehydrogenase complex dihydrolipoyllysine-residue succinyltransferase [Gammaproteobacteria bacterium]|jgi:2-oxoglutarate dehydrogenase E2 component (dihydrolipoamide succinyltransferase)|nr:2-oxoglutarate dehydrogenase complex dihydrolipoyllysine-residue succinyltransferase [Gammaproteobacteria bacterium]
MPAKPERVEVRVPTLPESVADATLVAWHKKAGEPVGRDENLVDVETDKVVLEMPAPVDGVLAEVLQGDGATVTGNQIIAVIEAGAVAEAAPSAPATPLPASAPAELRVEPREAESAGGPGAGPAVRRLIAEHGLDATAITPTGRDGRLTKGDVLAALESGETAPRTPPPPAAPSSAVPAATVEIGSRSPRRVPMNRLRARIAERLVAAQQTAAILTSFNEVDMSAVIELRNRYKEKFEEQQGARLGFMSFFVKACAEALKRFPVVNASVEGDDILYHDYFDIGIAVATPRGLVVPVLRDADSMSFAGIESAISEFGKRARSGQLTIEELTGGTFTITNGGVFGSLVSTPILNQPQSAILGMHKIQQRPVVVDGEIVARPMMYVALSYDHRIIDGADAVQFLVAVKEGLEDPGRLLLQI